MDRDAIRIVTEIQIVKAAMSVACCVVLPLTLGNVKSLAKMAMVMEAAMMTIAHPQILMWVHERLKCAVMVSMTIATALLMKNVQLVKIPMEMVLVTIRIVRRGMGREDRASLRFVGIR